MDKIQKTDSALSPMHTSLVCDSEAEQAFTKSTNGTQKLDTTKPDIRLFKRIRELGTYPTGWDGIDAVPAQPKTVQEAEMFMRAILSENIHEPHIALATDGEINFIWVLPNFRFDLGFYGDGTYAYYGKADNGQEFMSDDSNVNEELPQDIISLLKA